MRSSCASLAALALAGCAGTLPPPTTVFVFDGCRVEVAAQAPAGAVALGRVSVDVAAEEPSQLVDEALAGRACGWGASVFVHDGYEPLLARVPTHGSALAGGAAEVTLADSPTLDPAGRRVFARLYARR